MYVCLIESASVLSCPWSAAEDYPLPASSPALVGTRECVQRPSPSRPTADTCATRLNRKAALSYSHSLTQLSLSLFHHTPLLFPHSLCAPLRSLVSAFLHANKSLVFRFSIAVPC
ncbi:hypothetical protein ASPBRDRAFT_633757 [Aspergillus brasiliensis CBS 101740]|uniref:Uncharacterized protein n=1 Tax=Aspergillus brasiliensis (strain CBS 101740 / IMI 381727 / IBT 21946) TaxID=767769 RepID=A0A1L9UGB7_ASPBC|nr:hypothetical protein ASPBRDRAFT_633757 [Aspergillus brasiliensis CBS 101740]